jgi:uncharacterized membrane protein YedE/YeeE
MKHLISAISGGLFGTGLLISGMTDTTKVQGWLDVFGAWDPTLAFVMGGAIIPMAIAWRIVARREISVSGAPFPAPAAQKIDRRLVIGAILFGMGWALAGLCPGPVIASLSFGGAGGWMFLAAMLIGMRIAPMVARRLDRLAPSA